MDTIKKAHPYILKIIVICYSLSFIMMILALINDQNMFIYIALLSLLLTGYFHHCYMKRLRQQLKYLIQNADAIIDRKELEIIDGEGEISLLSHKLFILNKRYYTLLKQMKQDQVQLKDYIENISHQLKTPITSMRINEELLLNHIENQKEKAKLQEIYIQTLKISQLVEDLLTLALIDSHSIQFDFQYYSLNFIMNDIEDDLNYLLIKKNMKIVFDRDIKILCDKKWFEEALKNIIKNNIEKNKDSVIDIEVNELETMIELKIKDHGKGFIEEDIPHLFERFYRGQKQEYQGLGIGLALSKDIIEKHHGMIRAYNDTGATIEILLPKIIGKKKV